MIAPRLSNDSIVPAPSRATRKIGCNTIRDRHAQRMKIFEQTIDDERAIDGDSFDNRDSVAGSLNYPG